MKKVPDGMDECNLMDCSEFQEASKELKTENKALSRLLKSCENQCERGLNENKSLKEENRALGKSRDELLEELKLARKGFKSVLVDNVIQKAEALKEKETK